MKILILALSFFLFISVNFCFADNEIYGTVTGYKIHLVTVELYEVQCSELIFVAEAILLPCGHYHFYYLKTNTWYQVKPRHLESGVIFINESETLYLKKGA